MGKQKRSNVQWRWLFIGFLVLVIVISSGLFLRKSQQEADLQMQYAVGSCLFVHPDSRRGCIHVMWHVEEFVEGGLSVEELIAILKQIYLPPAAEVNQ